MGSVRVVLPQRTERESIVIWHGWIFEELGKKTYNDSGTNFLPFWLFYSIIIYFPHIFGNIFSQNYTHTDRKTKEEKILIYIKKRQEKRRK